MSVATAITALSARIQDAYAACESRGATMPATRDTANLSATIDSIPSGGEADPNTIIVYGTTVANQYVAEVSSITGSFQTLPSAVNRARITYARIGDGVTSLGSSLFYNAYQMAAFEIADSVEAIGSECFYNCSQISYFKLGKGITNIDNNAFYGCSKLPSVELPAGLTAIGTGIFRNCHSLSSVTIPDGISSISNATFAYCTALSNITIPASVTSIGDTAFEGCASNFTITLEGKTVAQIQAMNPEAWFGWGNMTITLVGTDGSYVITISCFLKGTDILLADGTTKKIENLTYNDVLKVWDFDEGQLGSAKVCWLTRPGLKSNHYYQLMFDDGTVLKTTGINSNHRIFSVDQSKFTNVCDAKIGDRVFSINGTLTITDIQYVEEECEYYNVMTSGKINCFANGILASDRYGNMYPISGMKYVKDGRTIRPYSDYEAVGISRYWYDNLRLGEVPETVEKTKEYIMKCEGQMLPLPNGDLP